jgi:hypothetical protein
MASSALGLSACAGRDRRASTLLATSAEIVSAAPPSSTALGRYPRAISIANVVTGIKFPKSTVFCGPISPIAAF